MRFLTYLAPSLPLGLFETIAVEVGRKLGIATSLASETRVSGPLGGASDPFRRGEADVGFLCSPSYLWMRAQPAPAVELVPAAPLFADPRLAGRPVYFSDVIVRADAGVASFAELRGGTFAYNDASSMSGYFSLLEKLRAIGAERFFAELRHAGSHLRSIELVAAGEVSCAAIDSNVLRHRLSIDRSVARRVRVLESWGPFPIQPVVARTGLPAEMRARLAAALLSIDPQVLAPFGVARFVPVDEALYASSPARERAA